MEAPGGEAMKTKPPNTSTATPPVRIHPGAPESVPSDPDRIVDKVRERYGRIAKGQESGCCGPAEGPICGEPAAAMAVRIGYRDRDLETVPEGANLGLGCGAPLDFLDLMPGETVLDLGS